MYVTSSRPSVQTFSTGGAGVGGTVSQEQACLLPIDGFLEALPSDAKVFNMQQSSLPPDLQLTQCAQETICSNSSFGYKI